MLISIVLYFSVVQNFIVLHRLKFQQIPHRNVFLINFEWQILPLHNKKRQFEMQNPYHRKKLFDAFSLYRDFFFSFIHWILRSFDFTMSPIHWIHIIDIQCYKCLISHNVNHSMRLLRVDTLSFRINKLCRLGMF